MEKPIIPYRLRAALMRLEFLEKEAGNWTGATIGESDECEESIQDICKLHEDLFRLEDALQNSYYDGRPFNPELNQKFVDLFGRWLHVAREAEAFSARVEAHGVTIPSRKSLLHAIREVDASLHPSYEEPEWLEKLCEEAIESNNKGDVTDLLEEE